MSKTKALVRHAKIRARERYGISLDENKMRSIVRKIQMGHATFLKKQSNRVSIYLIEVDGQMMRVVYDKLRKVLVTCLPMETK